MKAIFKFNGGLGALLCSKCHVIIKTGRDFTNEEKQAIGGEISLPAQYCENCATNNLNHVHDINVVNIKPMKQTAVEWLEDNLIGNPFSEKDFIHNVNVFKQAKAMEKDQIVKAVYDGMGTNFDPNFGRAEQYYNETYNK